MIYIATSIRYAAGIAQLMRDMQSCRAKSSRKLAYHRIARALERERQSGFDGPSMPVLRLHRCRRKPASWLDVR
jgi:hypothetical protein